MDLTYGKLSGNLQLHGDPDHPLFTGMLSLQRARALVNYLNTQYTCTNDIIVHEDNFELRNFIINDASSNAAIANGKSFMTTLRTFVLMFALMPTTFRH